MEAEGPAGAIAMGTGSRGPGNALTRLLLRDSLAFVFLFLFAVLLYGATALLFRSFTNRRVELARQFSREGREALLQHDRVRAIHALRVALEYAPDDRGNYVLLAEALAEDHHADEAMNYFLTLRETTPADGFLNLQLARLYRAKGQTEAALACYRAAALGNWEGDAAHERLQVELELADFLLELKRPSGARMQLLSAEANAPESAELDVLLGDKLLQAGDQGAALESYRKAIRLDPHDLAALSKAARLLFANGQYVAAARMLQLALDQHPEPGAREEFTALLAQAQRLPSLSLDSNLPPEVREAHLRVDGAIAKKRMEACMAKLLAGPPQPALQALVAGWQMFSSGGRLRVQGPLDEANATQWIYDTELTTAKSCGAPSGDDALLLLLAERAHGLAAGDPQEKR